MKITKVFKNKKGAALEMAILFMVIVFCFCTLLTTMTLTARSRIKLEKVYFNLDLDNDPNADEIVEDCLAYLMQIAATNRTLDGKEFVATAEEILTNIPADDNVAKDFTTYIVYNAPGATGVIPSKYAGYTREWTGDENSSNIVIDIKISAFIDISDFKTLKCIVILDNIRIDVEYKIDDYGTITESITQLVK